jgi:hypothetical protein
MVVIPAGSFPRQPIPPPGGGVGSVAVIAEVPVLVSLVAVIVAPPAASAVTSPEVETLLRAGLLELQVTTRPVSTLLLASRVTAESCCVPPTRRLALDGETDTVATGAGGGAEPVVVAETIFERLPNTALRFSVPRNATSWKL